MRIEPEISGVNVVLLGDFNPAIFTPAWFALHGLLPQSVADSAVLQVAHEQVTAFDTNWLHLRVTIDQFSVNTVQAPHVRLHDLVLRIFQDHLFHTPLRAFGINRNVHFCVQSIAERDRIGRTLAPVEPWGQWGRCLGLSGKHGGMTSLTMSQVAPQGRPAGGQINVTVEPSTLVGKGRTGVYVRVNDHYAIDNAGLGTAERLMKLFKSNFGTSIDRSNELIDHIMSLAKTTER